MAMSAEHRSKFAALHRQWWRLQISENSPVGRITPNKQTNKFLDLLPATELLTDGLIFIGFYKSRDIDVTMSRRRSDLGLDGRG